MKISKLYIKNYLKTRIWLTKEYGEIVIYGSKPKGESFELGFGDEVNVTALKKLEILNKLK